MCVCVCVQKLLSLLDMHVSRSVRQDGLQFLTAKSLRALALVKCAITVTLHCFMLIFLAVQFETDLLLFHLINGIIFIRRFETFIPGFSFIHTREKVY